eukprot:CAMPEP_0178394408 /NCGR_PEP_ID=MMETSP0689_2-20121128/12691_1 /TAXON_ID=160604 /ORGANISM="Amphidinium massartii, Strain CS-259" /LENGTH=108 /DNA_ID=CAMNT_0020015037 /DNA_START=101 /DNA_END=427 /DNA_ORIENTATION=+
MRKWNKVAAFESLRAAVLVTNGACTFSAPSAPEDEEAFQGIVFFGNATALKEAYESLRGNATAIQACQLQARHEFCTRFAPRRLLFEAGFASLLQNLTHEGREAATED